MNPRDHVIWILLGVGALLVVLDWVGKVRTRRRALAMLESTWGQPLRSNRDERPHDAWLRRLARHGDEAYRLDDPTWSDLEMDRVFAWADRTLSAIGAQILYVWLRQPYVDVTDALARRYFADRVRPPDIRTRLQRALASLGDRKGWDMAMVLQGDNPRPWGPPWMYAVLGALLLPLVVVGGFTQNPIALGLGLAVGFANPLLYYFASRATAGHIGSVRAIAKTVEVAPALAEVLPDDLTEERFPGLREDLEVCRRVLRRTKGLHRPTGVGASGQLRDVTTEYIRAFFLTEVRAYNRSLRGIEDHASAFERVLDFVGQVDATLSLAHLVHTDESLRRPRSSGEPRTIGAVALRHPLLDGAVPNDVTLESKSLLVTGSNMAGKSTFLRTLGVNVVLAQALGVTCADMLEVPPLRVLSLMHVLDDLEASVSLYQAELHRVRHLLEQADETPSCLFLLDEVFRGTNPADRLAASGATLVALARNNLVVASTHDLDLAEITRDDYDLAHFSERADDEAVVFDYRIKPGLSQSTNALALLERLGFPSDVVTHAREIAGQRSDSPSAGSVRIAHLETPDDQAQRIPTDV
jgi:hypothetical protein